MFNHVNNEADRQALIALQEKQSTLRSEIESKEAAALRGELVKSSDAEYSELAALMSAIDTIAKKYDHLLPQIADEWAD